jgi:hypothetical protein
MHVGDFVERLPGAADSRYGGVLATADDKTDKWLVSAGCHTYVDDEKNLVFIRHSGGNWQNSLTSGGSGNPGLEAPSLDLSGELD